MALAKRYNGQVLFSGNDLVCTLGIHSVRISFLKSEFGVQYKVDENSVSINLAPDQLLDFLIQFVQRSNQSDEIEVNRGELITQTVWAKEEGAAWITSASNALGYPFQNSVHKLGGNRILAEYFEGMLILEDDLGYYKGNIIQLVNGVPKEKE